MLLGGRAPGAAIPGLGPGIPAEPGTPVPVIWLVCWEATFDLLLSLACLRTRRLRNLGSWLLFRQLSTARWIKPRFERRQGFNSARAQPTALHSVS